MKKYLIVLLACLVSLFAFGCSETEEVSTDVSTPAVTPQESVSPEESSTAPSPETSSPLNDEVTPAPTPADGYASVTVDESGVFVSNYDCGIDVEVRWTLKSTQSGKVKLTADIYLLSYSVRVGARYSGMIIDVNGDKTEVVTQAVEVGDVSKREYSYLASAEYVLDLNDDCHLYDITVSFPFRGTYNGVSLPTIEASSYLNVTLDGVIEY